MKNIILIILFYGASVNTSNAQQAVVSLKEMCLNAATRALNEGHVHRVANCSPELSEQEVLYELFKQLPEYFRNMLCERIDFVRIDYGSWTAGTKNGTYYEIDNMGAYLKKITSDSILKPELSVRTCISFDQNYILHFDEKSSLVKLSSRKDRTTRILARHDAFFQLMFDRNNNILWYQNGYLNSIDARTLKNTAIARNIEEYVGYFKKSNRVLVLAEHVISTYLNNFAPLCQRYHLIDLATKKVVRRFELSQYTICDVASLKDNRDMLVLLNSTRDTIALGDMSSPFFKIQPIAKINGCFTQAKIDPTGTYIASLQFGNDLCLWNISKHKTKKPLLIHSLEGKNQLVGWTDKLYANCDDERVSISLEPFFALHKLGALPKKG